MYSISFVFISIDELHSWIRDECIHSCRGKHNRSTLAERLASSRLSLWLRIARRSSWQDGEGLGLFAQQGSRWPRCRRQSYGSIQGSAAGGSAKFRGSGLVNRFGNIGVFATPAGRPLQADLGVLNIDGGNARIVKHPVFALEGLLVEDGILRSDSIDLPVFGI